MERSLYITNYRNLGIKKSQRLVLNNFVDIEHMGNLVIVVGPNNTGKSNVLSALVNFSNGKFSNTDITTFFYLFMVSETFTMIILKKNKNK